MRNLWALCLVIFGGCAACSAMVTHYGGVAGESRDPSQSARVFSDPDPSWVWPLGAAGAAGVVLGGLVLAIAALRERSGAPHRER